MDPIDEKCPKCGAPRSGESCTRCGLVYSKFSSDALEEGVPGEIKLLWQDVERNWQERACHAAFVERSIAENAGGYAAACYRRRGDDPIAQEQIDRLTNRLTQMLGDSAAPVSTLGKSRRMAIALMLAIGAAVVALIVLLKRGLV